MTNSITQLVLTRLIATALFAVAAFLFINTQAFAVANPMEINSDIPVFTLGEKQEFTVSTVANEDATKMVRAFYSDQPDSSIVEMEYFEPSNSTWYPVSNPFGPLAGFPVSDATSLFRATFYAAGSYDVLVEFKEIGTDAVLASKTLTYVATETAHVDNQSELEAALANDLVTEIILDSNFEINSKILINRPVTIDGNGFSISSDTTDPTVWNSSTAYIFHIYNTSDVVIKDIKLTNANAAILVNGSTASLEGTIDVSGNGFGGIESSNGSVLTVSGASLMNGTEAYGQPTIWEDGLTGNTVVGFTGTTNSTIKPTQVQYYIGSHGVVRNEAQLNAALADSNIAVITVGEDFDLETAVQIDRSATIEGAGHTLTAESSVVNNAILITEADVTIKDLTIDGADNNIHGLQAYKAVNINLENVTVTNNGKSGITVNGSTVTVTNVTTTDNSWGGINVDQGSGVTEVTTLTVNGTSNHTEVNADIWKDDNAKTSVSVVDTNSQYDASTYVHDTSITGTEYVLKTPSPSSNRGGGGGSKSMRDRDNDDEGDVLGAATSTDSVATSTETTGTSTPVTYYNFTVDFGIGSEGTDVTNLQTILMTAGHLDIDAPTGFFGPLTLAAVQAYQTANSISNTGFVGPLTRAQLNTVPVVKTETVQSQIDAILAKIAELQAQLDAMNAE